MKVLWFSNTPASGSEFLKIKGVGGGWLSSLDKELSHKIELHIAFYYPKYAEDFEHLGIFYHPICKKNWKLEFILNRLRDNFIDKQDFIVYVNLINRIKPDLIHIHGTENPFGCIINKVDVPVVVSIQGNIAVIYHKFLSGIKKKGLSVIKSKLNRIIDFPYYHSFRKSYNECSKMRKREIQNFQDLKFVIGRTDWDKRITRVLAPGSTYFQSEEILRDSFYEKKWGLVQGNKLIIHTTNGNSPFKGFETLCHSLHLLNELNVEIEWRVAGIKEDDLIVKIVKKQLHKNYPKNGLVLLGVLNESELINRLLEANLYVMPSHIENSPNNLCEAMILGMPCIATFAGGTGSMLNDGHEGILIQDGDPWALAGAILELKNDPLKAINFGKAARVRALLKHNKASIIQNLIETYKTIISESRSVSS